MNSNGSPVPHTVDPAALDSAFNARPQTSRYNRSANVHRENTPDKVQELFREKGEQFIKVEPETRVQNCAVFHFSKEDHTLGNLLRDRILADECVLFSGYKVPHPLFAKFELRVQTDGSKTPKQAVLDASTALISDLDKLNNEFSKEYALAQLR
ncbi:MAG: DNA-directed RNA polymerase II core subunit [Chrysothrix sp. TS-e1954]|nr:MAG: DNA-directed RNA polymerase II core subunit [Chrysothrix sp. TS-e1954]